jgi:ATP-binding cassette subfamily B protein
LDYLREISGTTTAGTTLYGLKQAALQVGLDAEHYSAELDDLKDKTGFFILHVRKHLKYDHYVLYLGKTGNGYRVFDPDEGEQTYSTQELEEQWISKALLWLKCPESLNLPKRNARLTIQWLAPIVNAHSNRFIIISVLGLFAAILGFTNAIFIEKFVDNILPSKDQALVFGSLSLWIVLLFISNLFSTIIDISAARLSKSFNTDLMTRFISKLFHLPLGFFENRKNGDLISRREDADNIEQSLVALTGQGTVACFSLITGIIILSVYDQTIALVVLASAPVIIATTLIMRKRLIQSQKLALASRSVMTSFYLDCLRSIETIKNHVKEAKFIKDFLSYFKEFRATIYKAQKISILYSFLIDNLTFVISGLVIFITVLNINTGSMETGDFLAIISISGTTTGAITNLVTIYLDLLETKIAFERMHELVATSRDEAPQNQTPIHTIDTVQVHNLSYAFPGQLHLLDNLSLSFSKDNLTVLLGPTGSGKTTLIKLIQLLYTPLSGRITYDGKDAMDNSSAWRKAIGYVPQEVPIFNESTWENVALSHDSEDREAVLAFIQIHKLEFLFDSFPDGIDTELGEDAVKLSGGQKQLLGISRALYHQPKFLILDEPTASLDRSSQERVISMIDNLKKRVPILMITHNIETCIHSDYIYMLEDGRITFEGDIHGLFNYHPDFRAWVDVQSKLLSLLQ